MTFVLVATVVIPRAGSYGASAAVALALAAAGAITYYQFPVGPVLAVARYWRLVALSLVTVGVLAVPASPVVPIGLLTFVLYFFRLKNQCSLDGFDCW